MYRLLSISVIVIAVLFGCTPEGHSDLDKEMISIAYTESEKVFANPERGFYSAVDFYSASAAPITMARLKLNRTQNKTLLYTGYYLADYMESDIAPEYLDLIRKNMQMLRDGGCKCVIRFAYKTDMYETGHPWDASQEWVLRHIEQLKPIMQEFGDVILCLQAGFVGVWGEWGYTDNFVIGPSGSEDYSSRKNVLLALLDAMPKDRQVALRTPMYKKNILLDSYADSLTLETAFNGSNTARVCGHNDCFGASSNDYGTFVGNVTRQFWKTETKYVMMGGETCQVSDFCKCERSLQDMIDYHWTYLNSGYNSNVLNRWKTDGCYDEVERRLGYRISMTEVSYTRKPVAGEEFRIVINLKNTGFAAPVNPRSVELVLLDGEGREKVYALEDIDPRYWFAGESVLIDRTIKLPIDFFGECALFLNLPDPEETLRENPYFSIRLANDGIWNAEKGYNRVATLIL